LSTPSELSVPADLLKACIHCGMCLPACPTYGVTGSEAESPRGRLFLMHQAQAGKLEGKLDGLEAVKPHLDACLGCLACEAACPSGVQYGQLLVAHRETMQPLVPWWQRLLKQTVFKGILPKPTLLGMLTRLLRVAQQRVMNPDTHNPVYKQCQQWVNNTPYLQWAWQLLPTVPSTASPFAAGQTFGNPEHPTVALMTGCIMDAFYHRTHQATIDVLIANGYHVVIPPQTCCGALALHAGEKLIALELARRNIEAMPDNVDAIVLNSAGCGATLQEYHHLFAQDADLATKAQAFSRKVVDIMVLLSKKPLVALPDTNLSNGPALPLKVTYHGACHLHHAQKVSVEPLRVLMQLPGIEFIPMPGFDRCCGSAGIYNLEQPALSQALLTEKMDAIALTEATVILAGNPGCLVQIQAGIKDKTVVVNDTPPQEKVKPPVLLHPVELMAYSYGKLALPELDALRAIPVTEDATHATG
jgi:glycolate oxidase iron-sulfur subunit